MEKVTSFCLNNKKVILSLYFLLIVAFLWALVARITSKDSIIDNSVGVWFMQDDPELKYYDKYNEDFGQQEWSILLLETKSIYNTAFLQDLDKITEKIEKLSHVIKVTSITNVRDNETRNESLNYIRIYSGKGLDDQATRKNVEALKQKLEANPIFDNNLFKLNDSTTTVVLIQNDNFIRDPQPYRIELVDSINQIVKSYVSIEQHSLAGTTVVNAELNRASKRDVFVFYTVITLMITLFGWIALRRVKDILIMFSVVAGCIIPSMGGLALLKIPYNMVTLMMPTILIAISVLDVIHLVSDFHLEKRKHNSLDAIKQSIRAVWKPTFWTSFGTVVGFLSLATSTVYPIFQLGVFVSAGVILAWFLTMTIAPILIILFYPETQAYTSQIRNAGLPYTHKLVPLIGNYKAVWIGIAILVLIPAFFITRIKVDTNYTKFFGSSTEISKSYDNIKAKGYAQNPVNITIDFPEGESYTSKEYFSKVVQFEEDIKKLPEVAKIMTATELIKQIDKAYMGDATSEEKFKGYNSAQLGQLVLLGEMSGNEDIYDFLTYEKDKVQIIAMTDYMSSVELIEFKSKVYSLSEKYFSKDMKVAITGSTVLWANMDKQIVYTQIFSACGMGIFLLLLFPIIFRSWKLSLIGVFLNAAPILITYGIMGYLDIKINIATALIGGIALGIATDDTIHLLSRFKLGLKKGMGWDEAIDYSVINCGHSVIMTSIILIGAFFSMYLSDFLPTSHFGILVSWCIFIALYFDLFILPIVLRAMKPAKYKKAIQEKDVFQKEVETVI